MSWQRYARFGIAAFVIVFVAIGYGWFRRKDILS